MVKKDQFTLLFVPYFEFKGTNYIRNLFRFCVKIGKNVIINHSLTCMSRGGIEIEDDVMIGPEVTLLTANHDFADHWVLLCGKIHIKKNAWIGARAVILPGITVGENAVVAAGAVVTKDVEANTVVGGNPARVIRKSEG